MFPRLSLGIEYNPRADDMSLLASWVAVTEKRRRPAIVFGTSSDRIGTPEGQAYFVTISKDLDSVNGWPIAPYVGASHGTFDDRTRVIGGLHARLGKGFSSTVIHDGEQLHPTVGYRFLRRHEVSVLWIATEDVGISYSVAF